LVATAAPGDRAYTRQRRAAEILRKLGTTHPEHPGIWHYLIHAHDYELLADSGQSVANRYSGVAPNVPHALHMPSHIYVRLGQWQEAAGANERSAAAARNDSERLHPGITGFEELHAWDYWLYAELQLADDRQAKALMDRVAAVQAIQPGNFPAAYALAAMPGRFALERRDWAAAAKVRLHRSIAADDPMRWVSWLVDFSRAVGLARSGDADGARVEIGRIKVVHDQLVADHNPVWAEQAQIQYLEASAWLAHAEDRDSDALRVMHQAADLEDSTEKKSATPGPILPAREQLGDLMLETGQADIAFEIFKDALLSSPNRFGSVYGAARAAARTEDRPEAIYYYRRLLAMGVSDSSRPALAEARRFLQEPGD
jgi:tetratricopeptide (TPR) repeat protein